MDTIALLILVVGVCVYFLARKKSEVGVRWGIFIVGIGAGLLAGALWAVAIINSAFTNIP